VPYRLIAETDARSVGDSHPLCSNANRPSFPVLTFIYLILGSAFPQPLELANELITNKAVKQSDSKARFPLPELTARVNGPS